MGKIVPGDDTGVVTLSECVKIFFPEEESQSVLPKANLCFSIGVDRFILSCEVQESQHKHLVDVFRGKYKTKPLHCKQGRVRGWRAGLPIPGCLHAANAAAELLNAPQIEAKDHYLSLQVYQCVGRHYFGVQGNGSFTSYQWQIFHETLTAIFPVPATTKVSRVEVKIDYPFVLNSMIVIPIGLKSRFTLEENGFYYGCRASNQSFIVYAKDNPKAGVVMPYQPLTRVEARIRAKVPPWELATNFQNVFDRLGLYVVSTEYGMLHVPYAWRAADIRARKRFREAAEPFRLKIDPENIASALDAFAEKVLPASWLATAV